MRPLLLAVSGGVVSALLYLSVLTGSLGALILAYMAPLPLLMLGLSGGLAPVLIGGGAATLGVAAAADPMAALAFAVANLLPAAVVVRQALLARRTGPSGTGADTQVEWYPPGLLVMVLAGLGMVLVALSALLYLGEPGGIEGRARDFLASSFGELVAPGTPGPPGQAGLPEAGAVADGLARVLPGIVVISWLTMMIVNGVLAQGVLMRFGLNRRPPMRMADLALPPAAPVALAVLGLAALVLP
ncbi:MAG TPA: DUF2232 domain-containing protein, partial [Arenibaculum sp.]|nr:DUF2232 domain-containing protein [Arenibaculum sp.]